jgi:dTDP-4-dehydrorhamnose reductase
LAILGAQGLLGTNLQHLAKTGWEVTALTRKELNFPRAFSHDVDSNFTAHLNLSEFHVVINCIGFTNVDRCESEVELCKFSNIEIPKMLAQHTLGTKTKLVHVSTDHFESELNTPRSEFARVWGINEYGKSKLEAEKLVLEHNPDALILRTNFFGWGRKHRPSILDWMILQLEQNLQLDAFEDVRFTPISILELFGIIEGLLDINMVGIVNCSGSDSVSKYEFGKLVAEIFALDSNLVVPVSIDSKGLTAQRPKYLSLDNNLVKSSLGRKMPSLAEMLQDCASDRLWRDQINLMD